MCGCNVDREEAAAVVVGGGGGGCVRCLKNEFKQQEQEPKQEPSGSQDPL